MLDFESAKDIAFAYLRDYYYGQILSDSPREWACKIAVEHSSAPIDISLRIAVPELFPIEPLSFYVDKSHRALVEWLPHVQHSNLFLCLFDAASNTPNTGAPEHIVAASIARAREILEAGLNGTNINELHEEFIAYWAETGNASKRVAVDWLSLIEADAPTRVRIVTTEKPVYCNCTRLLVDDSRGEEEIKKLVKNSTGSDSYHIEDVFFLGDLNDLSPPFPRTNAEALEVLLTKRSRLEFDGFIPNSSNRAVLFRKVINGRQTFFGWTHQPPIINPVRTKLRSNSPSELYSTLAKSTEIERFLPQELTRKRLLARSDSVLAADSIGPRFIVAGAGSVGSFLLQNLQYLFPDWILVVDPEYLAIENIPRHILGLDSVGKLKAETIALSIRKRNPLIRAYGLQLPIIRVLQDCSDVVNECDLIFSVTADYNSEMYIDQAMTEGHVSVPVIYLWVEPHLAGGHLMYRHPNSSVSLQSFFDGIAFKNSIISPAADSITRREAGCQTTFIPYAATDVIAFTAAILPTIRELISTKPEITKRFSWIGNIQYLQKTGIPISEEYRAAKYGDQFVKNYGS